MPTLATLQDLNNYAEEVMLYINRLYIYEMYIWQILRLTGLRIGEGAVSQRWTKNSTTWTVETLKGSFNRTFQEDFFTPEQNNFLDNNFSPAPIKFYNKFRHQIQKAAQGKVLYRGTKTLDTHIFRHLVARNMYADGKTRHEIQIFLGEVSIINSDNYIFSDIYKNF